MDKKLAAENLLDELSSAHGLIIQQMKQIVEIYIKLAELDTKKEDMNKKLPLPREVRSIRQLELGTQTPVGHTSRTGGCDAVGHTGVVVSSAGGRAPVRPYFIHLVDDITDIWLLVFIVY